MSEQLSPSTLANCFTLVTERAEPSGLDPTTRYVGLEHIESGTGLLASTGSPSGLNSQVVRFRAGDVLFGRLRPYLRKVVLADFDGVCSPEILVLRPTTQVVPEFLFLTCLSARLTDWCVRFSAGGRMPRTSARDLGSFPLVLPSLGEQRRIAHLLGLARAAVRAATEAATEYASLRRSIFSEASSGAGTRRLGEVADIAQGYGLPKPWQGQRFGDIPWFKIADMSAPENKFGVTQAETLVDEARREERSAKVWPTDTLVFPRVGAAVLTEKKRLLLRPGICDENHLAVLPNDSIDPSFLLAHFESIRLGDLVQAGAVPSLNQKIIRGLLIPDVDTDTQRSVGRLLRAAHDAERDAITFANDLLKSVGVMFADLTSENVLTDETYDAMVGVA